MARGADTQSHVSVFLDWLTGTKPPVEERSAPTFSISDGDALAEYLGISTNSLAGVSVTERSALGVTAFYRAVAIVAGTIAGLPLKTYENVSDTERRRVPSFLDKPAGPYNLTAFSWKEMLMLHLLIRGETFCQHLYNGGGGLIGLWPVHPGSVDVKWSGARKNFKVGQDGDHKDFTDATMTQIMGLTTDGLRGISPLSVMKNAIGTGIAGEQAAARSFGNGLMIAGLVTTADGVDVDEDEAKVIKAGLAAKLTGVENAGDIAFVNRSLKFTPWSMTNDDAQFVQSREFQVIEFCRMIGVPPHLVGATEKQTSWGTGVAEQNVGLARYTLMPWTSRIEEALSALLPDNQFCEFDYSGLLQGSPKEEIELLIAQKDAGILTVDEVRRIRNLPPLGAAESKDSDLARAAAEVVQKAYLGVGKVITADEARALVRRAGADLAETFAPDAPKPEPVAAPAVPGAPITEEN